MEARRYVCPCLTCTRDREIAVEKKKQAEQAQAEKRLEPLPKVFDSLLQRLTAVVKSENEMTEKNLVNILTAVVKSEHEKNNQKLEKMLADIAAALDNVPERIVLKIVEKV